jgi:hypothetical protein
VFDDAETIWDELGAGVAMAADEPKPDEEAAADRPSTDAEASAKFAGCCTDRADAEVLLLMPPLDVNPEPDT